MYRAALPGTDMSAGRELMPVYENANRQPKRGGRAPCLWGRLALCIILSALAVLSPCEHGEAAPAEQYGRGAVLRVGSFLYGDDGMPGGHNGYIYEYFLAIAQFTGWKYEFINGTLAETLGRLERGEVDVVGYLRKDRDREKKLAFTALASGRNAYCLVVRRDDDRFAYEDFASFDGARTALVAGNPNNGKYFDYCRSKGFATGNQFYPNYEEAGLAIAAGKADILFSDNFRMDGGLKVVARFAPENFYFAVRKDNIALLEKLNMALNQINFSYPGFNSDLYNKYYGAERETPVVFTREEREYIKSSPRVVALYDEGWHPMEYYDAREKKFSGIVPEIVELISEKSGIKFAAESVDRPEGGTKGEKNIVSAMTYDYAWAAEKGAHVTPPFTQAMVVCVRKSRSAPAVSAAVTDRKYISSRVRKFVPGLKYDYYPSALDCIEAVRTGEAGCAFINAYEAGYYSSFAKYRNLYYIGVSGETQRLSLGVSAEADPLLFSIITKTLESLPASDIRDIVRRNTEKFYQPKWSDIFYTDPMKAGALAGLFAATLAAFLFLCGMYKIKKEKNEELELANEAKSKFLASMSHEIRTPLTTIIGINDEIAEAESLAEIKTASAKIKKASRHLLSLINDVLDMSKINEGKMELRKESFDLAETVRAIGLIYSDAAARQGLAFRLASFEGSLYVLSDELRIKQLLINLISNAIKYNRPGGEVTLRAELLRAAEREAVVSFSVEDTGIGIEKENIDAIFTEFKQEGRNSGAIKGTGLGLAIASRIAAMMGSWINVESELDKGSRFSFELCLERAPAVSARPDASRKSGEYLKGRRMIIAEDHPVNANIVRKILEKKGIECLMADNGKICADIFAASEPGDIDAVFMDIQMPIMNGYEAARAIRNMKRADALTVPIIALTANAFDEDVEKTRAAGMNAHVVKPIDISVLYRVLAKFFER